MEESFHEDIEFINNNGLSVKDWGAGDREKTFFIGNEGRWLTRKTIKQVKSKFLNFTQYKVKNDEKEEWEFLERMENNLPSAKKIYDRDFKENEYKTLDEFEKDAPDKILKKVLEKCDIPRNFWENWRSLSKEEKKPLKIILIEPTIRDYAQCTLDNKLEIPTPFTGRKGGKRTKEGYKGDKYLHEYDENKEKFLLKIWIFELFKEKNRKDKYENLLSHKKDKFIFYSFSLPKTFWTITNKEREKTKEG